MNRIVLGVVWVFFAILFCKPTFARDILPEAVEMLKSVNAIEMGNTMKIFSAFRTRYHRSPEAIRAQAWLKSDWEETAQGREDIEANNFYHPADISPMPSVILTIEGSIHPEKIIILGAHADSINVDVTGISIEEMREEVLGDKRSNMTDRKIREMFIKKMNLRATIHAPGADDNASGIAVITEIFRVLIEHDYHPENTIMIIAYSAEEIGARGSDDIAESFAREYKNVISVLNFDMTNFRGSPDLDLVLVSDYTHPQQNACLGRFADELGIKWADTECGRCSDHFSWHKFGFPASMLTEARTDEINPNWHKGTDTFEASGGTAEHSVNFAKLALAFLIEMDRFGMCRDI